MRAIPRVVAVVVVVMMPVVAVVVDVGDVVVVVVVMPGFRLESAVLEGEVEGAGDVQRMVRRKRRMQRL